MKFLGAQVISFILVNVDRLFAEDKHKQKLSVQMQALWAKIHFFFYNKST